MSPEQRYYANSDEGEIRRLRAENERLRTERDQAKRVADTALVRGDRYFSAIQDALDRMGVWGRVDESEAKEVRHALRAALDGLPCVTACVPCQHGAHDQCMFPNCHDEGQGVTHEPRMWVGQQVCSTCHFMPQPGAMKPMPWPCHAVRLAESQEELRRLGRARKETMIEIIWRVRDLACPTCEHPECEEHATVEVSLLGGCGDTMLACEGHKDYCKRLLMATR